MPTSTDLVLHTFNATQIPQRVSDNYMDATAMCQATGKRFNDYTRLQTTQDFLAELEADAGIPATGLIQIVRGGTPDKQGTWVHPFVAVNLAQWCSPRFAVFVSRLFIHWLRTNTPRKPSLTHQETLRAKIVKHRTRIQRSEALLQRYKARLLD